jgi:hypothetical protein
MFGPDLWQQAAGSAQFEQAFIEGAAELIDSAAGGAAGTCYVA